MTDAHINLLTKIVLETATLKDFQITANKNVVIDFLREPDSKSMLAQFGLLTSNQPASFFIFEADKPNEYRYLIGKVSGAFNWKVYSRGSIPLT